MIKASYLRCECSGGSMVHELFRSLVPTERANVVERKKRLEFGLSCYLKWVEFNELFSQKVFYEKNGLNSMKHYIKSFFTKNLKILPNFCLKVQCILPCYHPVKFRETKI